MTREIKFRAWDKTNNSMHMVACYEFGMNRIIIGDKPSNDGTFDFFRDVIVPSSFSKKDIRRVGKDVVLMQYTGIRDKKGKLIYDVDIVKSKTNLLSKVIWKKDGWTVKNCFIAYQDEPVRAFSENEEWEIIGNIYENPELLNK